MRPGGGAVFRATLRPVFVATRDGLVRLVERRYGIRTSGVIELDELASRHLTGCGTSPHRG